jgi:hypothetical protein
MNRTSIRKFITAISMKYIMYYFDPNNTQYGQSIVVTENDYTLNINRNCYIPGNNSNDTYLEDYRIDFDGIINNKNTKSLFFIVM